MGASEHYTASPKSESHPFESLTITSMGSDATDEASERESSEITSPGQRSSELISSSKARLFTRNRSPPRDKNQEMYCDHEDCSNKHITFGRLCEWNKHMDKHERPYKCKEQGCERLLGFTYSGGLLRHQREVHKKNVSMKKPLYCPFAHCNRSESSGNGFTRLENLNEHKRRRHTGQNLLSSTGFTPIIARAYSTAAVLPDIRSQSVAPLHTDALKRKRDSTSTNDCESEDESEGHVSSTIQHETDTRTRAREERLHKVIKRLREETAAQQEEINRLKNQIQTLGG